MISKYRILLLRELPPLVSHMRQLSAVVLPSSSTRRDINLLFLFSGGAFPSKEMFEISKRLEKEIGQQFGESPIINPVPRLLAELDKYFLGQLLREGYVVYGEMPSVSAGDLELKPVTIISYGLKDKEQRDKTRINYALYGRKLKKGQVQKAIPGLLQKAGGHQLGPGVISVPEGSKAEITALLKREEIAYEERKVWADAEKRA